MKRTFIIFMCLISLTAMAQDTKVIGGYLLDGQDSLEELDASVLVEYRSKKKILTGKGMRIAGAVIKMSDESKGPLRPVRGRMDSLPPSLHWL